MLASTQQSRKSNLYKHKLPLAAPVLFFQVPSRKSWDNWATWRNYTFQTTSSQVKVVRLCEKVFTWIRFSCPPSTMNSWASSKIDAGPGAFLVWMPFDAAIPIVCIGIVYRYLGQFGPNTNRQCSAQLYLLSCTIRTTPQSIVLVYIQFFCKCPTSIITVCGSSANVPYEPKCRS